MSYLVVIAWLYVVLMMSLAEAFGSQGTVLGAIVTFFLYGIGPIALVVYLMGTPLRRKAQRAKEAAEAASHSAPLQPDACSHATTAAQKNAVASMREKE